MRWLRLLGSKSVPFGMRTTKNCCRSGHTLFPGMFSTYSKQPDAGSNGDRRTVKTDSCFCAVSKYAPFADDPGRPPTLSNEAYQHLKRPFLLLRCDPPLPCHPDFLFTRKTSHTTEAGGDSKASCSIHPWHIRRSRQGNIIGKMFVNTVRNVRCKPLILG